MPTFLFPNGKFFPTDGVTSFEYPNESFYERTTDNSFLSGDGSFFHATDTGAPEPGSAAELRGGTIQDTQTALGILVNVADGSFAITIDGTAQQLPLMNFTALHSLTEIAAMISANLVGATCDWVPDFFLIITDSTGPSATISYASAPASGTDLSGPIRLTAANGATIVPGA